MAWQIVITEHSSLEHVQPWPCGCLIPVGGSVTDAWWLLSHDLVDSNVDHLWGISPAYTKQPQDHGCGCSRCDFLTDVQWLLSTKIVWDSNHWTSVTEPPAATIATTASWVWMLIVIPSQMFSDYYQQDHETVTTENICDRATCCNHSVMGLCAHCDSLTDLQRLPSSQSWTVTTNHLWWSHLFVYQAWKVSTGSLTLRHHYSCKTKRSCTCSPECQVHHFTYVLQYIIVRYRVYKPEGQSCSNLSIVRALLRPQKLLNHVNPIERSV